MASSAQISPRSFHFPPPNQQLPSFDSFLRSTGQPGSYDSAESIPQPSLVRANSGHREVGYLSVTSFESRVNPGTVSTSQIQPQPVNNGAERSSFGYWPATTSASYGSSGDHSHYITASAPVAANLQPPFQPNSPFTRTSISGPFATLDISTAQPRYVLREEHIPGKGPCFVYDDGTICQTTINGEAVNPKWGTTKQGKPRKRLGQACNTCREKKIKCDPSVPKCAQCLKFNRECKFETSARTPAKSPQSQSSATSPAQTTPGEEQPEPRRESSSSADASHQTLAHSGRSSKSSMTMENFLTPKTGEGLTVLNEEEYSQATKRRRTSTVPHSIGLETHQFPDEPPQPRPGSSRGSSDGVVFSLATDPYDVDPSATVYLVSQYFNHINNAYCYMLPRRAFLKWVKSCHDKSRFDHMLLFAMMALGAVFTKRSGQDFPRARFEDLAAEGLAQSMGIDNLQIMQTRFILANLDFVQADGRKGWDLLAAAARDACVLGYNTEDGIMVMCADRGGEYDLPHDMLLECRRRTFWSIYVLVSYSTVCISFGGTIHKSDCLLRLPCSEADFESGTIPEMPFFLHSVSAGSNSSDDTELAVQMGTQGFLVMIASMTSDIMNHVKRMKVHPKERVGPDHDVFRQQMRTRLQAFNRGLREMYQASSLAHTTTKSKSGRHDGLGGLHILYHYACMLLNRYVRHGDLGPRLAEQFVYEAYLHAGEVLDTVQRLQNHVNKLTSQAKFIVYCGVTSPIILGAVDTLTAAGSVSILLETGSRSMELITAGIEMLDTLSEHWTSMQMQRDLIKFRLQNILKTHNPEGMGKKTGFYSKTPMLQLFPAEDDIIYGLPRMQYLHALGLDHRVRGEDELYEINL